MFERMRNVVSPAIMLSIAVLCLGSTCAWTQNHVFSLWTSETMAACDVYFDTPLQPFDVYVFIDPDTGGVFAVEYKLEILPGHSSTSLTLAPFVSAAAIGSWTGSPGITAPFTECQTELTWIAHMTMEAPDLEPGFYTFQPHDDTGSLFVLICTGNRPEQPVTVYNVFGYNESCMWYHATEETSWGAIKEMYRR